MLLISSYFNECNHFWGRGRRRFPPSNSTVVERDAEARCHGALPLALGREDARCRRDLSLPVGGWDGSRRVGPTATVDREFTTEVGWCWDGNL